MKNSKNKIIVSLVCGMIIGSLATSFIGKFEITQQENLQSHSNNHIPNSNNSSDDSNRKHLGRRKGGRHGLHDEKNSKHQDSYNEEDSKDSIDTTSSNLKDGTYTGVADGYSPELKVEVTVSDKKISDIQIVSHNETPGFYETAFEQVPSEIINKQNTDVDTVSGATYSSNGIINAVEEALVDAKISDTN